MQEAFSKDHGARAIAGSHAPAPALLALAFLGSSVVPETAWAGWGDEEWGVLRWGELLPQVPLLGPWGLGLLALLGLVAGVAWGRAGSGSTSRDERSGRKQRETMAERRGQEEQEMTDDRQQELLERIATLEGKLARIEARRNAVLARIRALNPWLRTAVFATVLAIPLAAYASSVSVPFLFVNGTLADADEVNANFAAVEAAVNDNDARIAIVEGIGADITDVIAGSGLAGGGSSGAVALAVDPAQVQSRVLGNCPLGSSIREIAADGSVSCQTDTVGSGDITAVNAGTGLVGGGSAGSVTLSVAASGITSSLIQDGTILAGDISATTSPIFGGVTVNGPANVNGALKVDSGADIRIQDDFNGFRWYDAAGTTQFGAILMRSAEASFFDATNSRYVVSSRANGIGIGTTAPVAGFAATTPSLHVTGLIDIGLERVSANYALDSTASCHAHGNLTCYYGTGFVTCPVGKKVLGGGSSGTNARYGQIGQSFPASTTSWSCSASYDLANNTRNCYAICARIQ